ncbi:uncharacterized protein BP5553_10182 [Venustampulla echinocandica]|uniref:U6 small nuclear RNA (adenine-(43)-N(6))-methyltransferase n=1 Tax=Venustampulla echinocandica TaxID=2656787 RepID=A0A370TAJ5_9HELO|nr:uncharacterized protein BP5553_10182 [Venustampulla echinocandica]RDL30837.1 hypothetical protein BP5553_10182 [Venustampulla echinocandica]
MSAPTPTSTSSNIYKEDVDFAELALQDAEFAKVLKPNGQLDFSNPESVKQLTTALLKRDFGLKISLPPDRLCPPVPNRLNYLLWIQGLLDTTSSNYSDAYDPQREVFGLDIGTGASCIYPMIGCTQRPKWRFAATGRPRNSLITLKLLRIILLDIDEKSLQFATQNIEQNGLQNRIKLLQTQRSDPLLPLDIMRIENIDFSMCNPPFYESKADMLTSAAVKQRPPFTACTGSENEMVTPGGEVAFVSRMINQSLVLRERVQWYTSMLGKFSSLATLIEELKKNGIENYAATEFVQGNRTRRWAIAWSFDDLRPRMAFSRNVNSIPKTLLPFPSEYHIAFGSSSDTGKVSQHINDVLSGLPLKWMWKPSILVGVGFSDKAVWSRAARRHMAKKGQEGSEEEEEEDDDTDIALGFKIYVEGVAESETLNRVTVRWIKGHDNVLFESFCGMVKRKIDEVIRN